MAMTFAPGLPRQYDFARRGVTSNDARAVNPRADWRARYRQFRIARRTDHDGTVLALTAVMLMGLVVWAIIGYALWLVL